MNNTTGAPSRQQARHDEREREKNQQQSRAVGAQVRARLGFVPGPEALRTLADTLRAQGAMTPDMAGRLAVNGWQPPDDEIQRLNNYTALALDAAPQLAEKALDLIEKTHPGRRVELSTIGENGRRSACCTLPADREKARAWLIERIGFENIYIGREARNESWSGAGAARSEHVSESRYVGLDFDQKEGERDEEFQARVARIVATLAKLGPLWIINTGGGLHVWFNITPSTDAGEIERRAKMLNKLSKEIGSDPVSDAPRVLRLPFTVNVPNKSKRERGRDVALAHTIQLQAEPREWDPDELAAALRKAFNVSAAAEVAPAAAVRAQTRQAQAATTMTTARGATSVAALPPSADKAAAEILARRESIVARALAALPNEPGGPYDHRDDWLRIIGAVKTLGEDFRALAEEWTARWGGTPEGFAKAWESDFTRTGPVILFDELARFEPALADELRNEWGGLTFGAAMPPDAAQTEEAARSARANAAKRGRAAEVALDALKAEGAKCWMDAGHKAHVTLPTRSGDVAHWALDDAAGQRAISAFVARRGVRLSKNDKKDLFEHLEAEAEASGEQAQAHVRAAVHDGAIYWDTAGDTGVFKSAAGGWRTIRMAECPVRFIRRDGMQPLPHPATPPAGGTFLTLFDPHASLPPVGAMEPGDRGVQARAALLTFSAGALAPEEDGTTPILFLNGPPRSGKTTTTRIIGDLLDPHAVGVTTPPRDAQHFAALAANMGVLRFDNLTGMAGEIQNIIAAATTGASHTARKLYSDGSLASFRLRRAILLNGVSPAFRADVMDRSLALTLDPHRTPWNEVEAGRRWRSDLPAITHALLDLMAAALKEKPGVDLDQANAAAPRFRAAATLAEAMARALGWRRFLLVEALADMAREGQAGVLAADPLVSRLAGVLAAKGQKNAAGDPTWAATPADWLDAVRTQHGHAWGPRGGPRTPAAFSGSLVQVQTALEANGWKIERGKEGRDTTRKRVVTVSATPEAVAAAYVKPMPI